MKKYLLIFIVALTVVMAAGGVVLYVMKGRNNANPQNAEAASQLASAEGSVDGAAESEGAEASASENVTVTLSGLGGADATVSGDTVSEDSASVDEAQKKMEMLQAIKDGNPALTMEMVVEETESNPDGVYTLGFVGDILFDPNYAIYNHFRQTGFDLNSCVKNGLLEEMNNVDFMMVNNEFPYSDEGSPQANKTYTFRAPLEAIEYMKGMGVDAASVANNHAFDYGEAAFLDTLEVMEENEIPHVGGGMNLEEASRPLYLYMDDYKVAIVAASQIERMGTPHSKGATADSPGMLRSYADIEPTLAAIREAKENSDYVILFIHWGTEKEVNPDWCEAEQLPQFIDAGADCIIGAHPHILQPIDYVNGVPVVYSMGNFWFNSKTLDSCMIELEMKDGELAGLKFIPCLQSGCTVKKLDGADADRLLDYMRSISPNVNIDEEGYVTPK